jgi:hypothetical protein
MLIKKYPIYLVQLKKYIVILNIDLYHIRNLFFNIINRLPNDKQLALQDLDRIYVLKQNQPIVQTLVDLVKFLVRNCSDNSISKQLKTFYQYNYLEYYLDSIG